MQKCRDIFAYMVLYGEYSGLDLILSLCIVYVLCKEYELNENVSLIWKKLIRKMFFNIRLLDM